MTAQAQPLNLYPKMTALAQSFPTLEIAPGVEPFDPDRLDEWASSGAPSHGALYAARFILAVWAGRAGRMGKARKSRKKDGWHGEWSFSLVTPWRCGPFDVVDALGTWDWHHRNAFVAWAQGPWWP